MLRRVLGVCFVFLTVVSPAEGQWLDTLPPADSPYWWTLTDEISPEELRRIYLDRRGHQERYRVEARKGALPELDGSNLGSLRVFIEGNETPELHRLVDMLRTFSLRAHFDAAHFDGDLHRKELIALGLSETSAETIVSTALEAWEAREELKQSLSADDIAFSKLVERLERELPRSEYLEVLSRKDFGKIAKIFGLSKSEVRRMAEAWSRDIFSEVYMASAEILKSRLSQRDWEMFRRYLLEVVAPSIDRAEWDDDLQTITTSEHQTFLDEAPASPEGSPFFFRAKPDGTSLIGDFSFEAVRNVLTVNPTELVVEVFGAAEYRGSRTSSNTDHCLIMSLNRDQDGSDGLNTLPSFDYNAPEQPDVNGIVVFRKPAILERGHVIACPDEIDYLDCQARLGIPFCGDEGGPVQFGGVGSVWAGTCSIAPGVSSALSDEAFTAVDRTPCLRSLSGTVEALEKGASVTLRATIRDGVVGPVVSTQTVTVAWLKGKYNGNFTFPEKVPATGADGTKYYEISVDTQPANGQRCSLDPSTEEGYLTGKDDIEDIRVVCSRTCHAGKTIAPPAGEYLLINERDTIADPPVLPTIGNCVPDADPQHCTTPDLVRDDFVVMDLANNLLWTWDFQVPPFSSEEFSGYLDYSAAKDVCSKLELAGRTDWRLPDIEQLRTLLPTCHGQLENCEAGYQQAYGSIFLYHPSEYWSSTQYFRPADCINSNYICFCGSAGRACMWTGFFSEEDTFGLCDEGHTHPQTLTGSALTRCVTELVP